MRQLALLTPDELEALLVIRARRRSSALEDAARRYAAAVVAHDQAAVGRSAQEALLETEAALHDLIVRAGFSCPYCTPAETCPGAAL